MKGNRVHIPYRLYSSGNPSQVFSGNITTFIECMLSCRKKMSVERHGLSK